MQLKSEPYIKRMKSSKYTNSFITVSLSKLQTDRFSKFSQGLVKLRNL